MKWSEDAAVNECRAYFSSHPVLMKLLKGFWEKYRSYGSFTGNVTLKNLTQDQREVLEGFFQKSFHGQKSASISAAKFEKALKNSRFHQITPERLFLACFGAVPVGKRDEAQRHQEQWSDMIMQVQSRCKDPLAQSWLEAYTENPGDFPVLSRRLRSFGDDILQGRKLLEKTADILIRLPQRQDQVEYRAVFSAKLTGNPHSFDDDRADGRLLYELVKWFAQMTDGNFEKNEEKKLLFPAQKKQQLYLKAGILLDDLSNYTMLSGICSCKRDGKAHKGMTGFFEEKDMVLVPLSVIARWSRVRCIHEEIFIVENPSVFSVLQSHYKNTRSLMCMNGQPRLSALILLDLLADAGVKVYYAGDFDPEGLNIAQKLCSYYPGPFEYWHMSAGDCTASLSEEILSPRRLKMLDKITDPKLRPAADILIKEKRSGYQERILERYIN